MSLPPIPNINSLFTAFSSCVSISRIEAYRVSGDDNHETLTKCVWNICLSEALYPVLQNLEIGLRNTLHAAAEKSFGTSSWYGGRASILRASEQQQVTEAEAKLTRLGRPIEPNRVIAELDFGFWTSLFDSRYDRSLINRRDFLKDAFPLMPRRFRTRHTLSGRLNNIRKLRNRIFHHERILHYNLIQEHKEMHEALGWINPKLQQMTQIIDRFPEVVGAAYYTKLKAKLNE